MTWQQIILQKQLKRFNYYILYFKLLNYQYKGLGKLYG